MKLIEILNRVRTNSGQTRISVCSPSLRLIEDLDLDSIQLAELAVVIEAESGIDVFKDSIPKTIGCIELTLAKLKN